MYLVAWLNPGVDDRAAARAAATHGVDVIPLSTFCIRPLRRQGLVLGYIAYEVNRIRLAVKTALSGAGENPCIAPDGKAALRYLTETIDRSHRLASGQTADSGLKRSSFWWR